MSLVSQRRFTSGSPFRVPIWIFIPASPHVVTTCQWFWIGMDLLFLCFREFFESVLRQVSENLKSPHAKFNMETSVANFSEFVANLSQILEPQKDSCVISITSSETLRNLDPLLLPGLETVFTYKTIIYCYHQFIIINLGILRLSEICQQNICVVFVSRIPWSRWQITQVNILNCFHLL